VTVNLRNNSAPPAWLNFNQTMTLDASTAQPITLLNYAIGSMAGTVAGMGASFNYAQFKINVTDADNQYTYSVPVSYDGAATYGTFNFPYFRTPLSNSGVLSYNFSANGGGDYTSTMVTDDVHQGQSRQLSDLILVSLLNVYAAVTVTKSGQPYAAGAWISAQMVPSGTTPPSGPPTTGMGNGYTVSNYFSTVTKGDGTSTVQCQLSGGVPTTYVFSAQIVDTTTFATSTKSTTITMPTNATFANPKGVSFGF
jgi:hypothetical protein